ncbi:MAG: ribose transport system ATP-binding protein [Phycisphaerales bacterium]|jgi:ABC-type sugar transport system ATPase subunit|nr:ribose transport system ATP-binding protein [Phycisphaerales bacterium]
MFIQFENITKQFAGVTALDSVSMSIRRGECHALMGENGAGKSTLGKVLAGIHRADAGTMRIDGVEVNFRSPRDAGRAGVGMVHQELAFCPELSVAENLCMGQYPRRMGIVSRSEMRRRAEALLSKIGVELDVRQPMRALSTAQEQLVQIASAVGTGARILVFDEPTSSLSEPEAQRLFGLIEELKKRGVTMIYVSHRMPEVFRLCDRLSVLRDGKYIGTLDRASATQDDIVRMMIGRSLEQYFPKHLGAKPGETALSVRNLSSPGKFTDVSFELRAGEILGFAGLVGSGRSEVAKAIFGLDSSATGRVEVLGRPMRLGSIREAMRRGLGLVPEDRKRQGLVLMMSGRTNTSLAMLDRLRRLLMLDFRRELDLTVQYFDQLRVKTPSVRTPVAALSGGNQQKIALAKWLARQCKVLIVDEPTRGVDVGAKAAIHGIIDDLARKGIAIILISSELPEVINLATRIVVMRNGKLVSDVPREQATQEYLLRLMAGVETPSAA